MQHIVLQEYVQAVREAQRRVQALEGQIRLAIRGWSLEPVVQALMAMRGSSLVTAVTIVAELGDISRFRGPRQLMAYLGLVPSEYSSGGKRRQGGLTRTGNGQKRAEQTSEAVQAIAWEGQKRLCGRYQSLLRAGKAKQQVTAAVAREMCGFIWAIACEVGGKRHASKATA